MRTLSGRNVTLDLPDLAALGYDCRPLQQAMDAYHRLLAAGHRGDADVAAAREALSVAEAVDREARVVAVKSGKPMPAEKATARAKEKLADAERQVDALAGALESVERDLIAAVEEHRTALAAAAEERVTGLRPELREVIEALVAKREELARHRAFSSWVQGFPSESIRYKGGGTLTAYVGLSAGEPLQFATVLQRLIEETEPPAQPPEAQPLQPRLTGVMVG